MVLLTDILIALLLVAVIFLVIYLIFFLKRALQSIENLEEDVHQLSLKSYPILDDLNDCIQKINEIADQAQEKITDVNEAFNSVKSIIQKFIPQKGSSEREGENKNHIYDLIKNIQAVSKGVSAFWKSYKTNN